MQVNKVANRFTIIDSKLGILALRVDQEEAIQTIYDLVEDEPPISEVFDLLETPPDPAAWRTEWAEAVAVELAKVDAKADDAATIAEVRRLHGSIDALRTEHDAFVDETRFESKRQRCQDIKRLLETEHSRLIQVLADDVGIDYSDALPEYSRLVWHHLESTALYREFCSLCNELEAA